MVLPAGTRLGGYEIVDIVGQGGMGEVYRAQDSRLRRDVALKVLPPAAADDERRERFRREAQAVAALNHPGIVTVHSIEETDGIHFLTMEFVDGKTLDAKIPSGGMAVSQWLAIATALADAIGAAHGHGIVHRDLKPGNVMVTGDGRVKVLDFGLAKLQPARMTEATTQAAPITRDGRILGTLAYMSPEQAEGGDVDHRSDIFSLGVMLYEMATGTRPFGGQSDVGLLAAIVKDTPTAVTDLRPEWPNALARLIRRCLAKDPTRRFQSAVDLRNELEDLSEELSATSRVAQGTAPADGRAPRARLGWTTAALVVALGAVGGYVFWITRQSPPPTRTYRLTIQPPSGLEVADQSAPVTLAISPDGQWVAFEATSMSDPARSGLYLRSASDLEPRLVRAALRTTPFFSADSQWLGFQANGTLWKVPVAGGQPQRVCAAETEFRGASWSDDGSIVWANSQTGLWRVTESNAPALVAPRDPNGNSFFFPHVLPGGKAALVMLHPDRQIAVVSLESGRVIRTLFPGMSPRYVRSGFVVFRRLDAVYAAPFDLGRLIYTADPRPILSGVRFNGGGSETSAFDLSDTGDLVYMPAAGPVAAGQLVWLDRQGRTEAIAAPQHNYQWPTLDPGGKRIAVHIENAGDRDLFVYDLETTNLRQLTHGLSTGQAIAWTSDGRSLVFSSMATTAPLLFRVDVDGGATVQLTESAEYGAYKNAYDQGPSVYGNMLLFSRQVAPDNSDILTRPLEPARVTAVKFLASRDREFDARFSPDGRWVAYCVEDGAGRRIEVRSFREPDRLPHIVTSSGDMPRWSRDGKILFYVSGRTMWAVPVLPPNAEGNFANGAAARVLDAQDLSVDLTPTQLEPVDDKKFLAVTRARPERREPVLVYMPNWLASAREQLRVTPTGK